MSFESYTQHMPTLQRTTFWSNYMSGLKGKIEILFIEVDSLNFQVTWALWNGLWRSARSLPSPSTGPWTWPCMTLSMVSRSCKIMNVTLNHFRQSSVPRPHHVWLWVLQASAHRHSRQRTWKAILLSMNRNNSRQEYRSWQWQLYLYKNSFINNVTGDQLTPQSQWGANHVFLCVSSLWMGSWKTTPLWPANSAWVTPEATEDRDPARTVLWGAESVFTKHFINSYDARIKI